MKQVSRNQKRYVEFLQKQGKMPVHSEDEIPENFDEEMGEAHEYDSSGEPHTEDKFEDEQPMEFMGYGGRVKRMARGGMVPHPKFAQALRKQRM